MVIAAAGAIAIGEWREGATVVFLFALAQWLEARTLARARGAIRALLDLAPREALVRRGDVERRIPIDEVTAGELVIVRPGDKVPVDGVVAAGHSDVNEAPITGESLPVDKGPGAEVYAGTINGHGALEVTVTRVGRDTRVARIIHLVEEAQARRAPIQSFVDRFGRIYTPGGDRRGARRGDRAAARGRAGVRVDLSRAGAAGRLVPVRPGDLDAGVDRGGRVGGGQSRRADQGRRGARAPRRRAGAGLRQDRHPDRRRAGSGRHRGDRAVHARRGDRGRGRHRVALDPSGGARDRRRRRGAPA